MSFFSLKLFLFNSFILFIYSQRRALDDTENEGTINVCPLTGKTPMDPYPSLSTCYKYNNEACCASVHDNEIGEHLRGFLTESCIRRFNVFWLSSICISLY